MGFNSQIQIDFVANSYEYPKGDRVVGLIDNVMLLGWDIGVERSIHVLDKGNDTDFINLQKKLSSYVKLAQ